jgi:hypothetical protein
MSTGATTPPPPPGAGPAAGRRPFGEVVASVVDGLKTLARQRVELARIEAAEAAKPRAAGVGMFGAAGVVVLYAVLFFSAAGAAALAIVLPLWAATLLIGVALLVVAAILVVIGRRSIRNAPAFGEQTSEGLKEDGRWAKQQIGR